MQKQKLKAEKRIVTGRKVKRLRKEGVLPANLYGKKIKSTSVQVNYREFESIYRSVGETGVVELELEGELRPVLIQNVHIHPVADMVLHADFYQVDLTKKVKASIPIEIVGEAVAVSEKKGVLLTVLDQVEVEALPTDLLEKITVDVSKLCEVGETIKVGQLPIPSKVAVLTDTDLEVVKIGELITKKDEALAKQVEEDAATAQAEAEAEKEGEEKKEEGEEEKKVEGKEQGKERSSQEGEKEKGEKEDKGKEKQSEKKE